MADFKDLGGVRVTGFISPSDTLDTYAVIDPIYGIDGWRNVADIAEMNAITDERRRAGMIVGVNDGATFYKLKSGPWNHTLSDWELFQLPTPSDFGTYVSGITLDGNILEVTRTDGVILSQDLSAVIHPDIFTTGATLVGTSLFFNTTDSLSAYTVDLASFESTLTGDTFVISGVYDGTTDTITLTRNDAGTIIITGITDTFVTGATFSGGTLDLTRNDGDVISVSGISTIGDVTYTNFDPTPITIGGISAGSTFSARTMQEMWDDLLYPYQPPSMNITSTLFTTYEFGQTLPSGLQTVNYSVSNPGNIATQPPDVGDPSTNIAGATFPIDPFTLLGAGSFQINIPVGFTYTTTGSLSQSNTITLQGTNSVGGNFSDIGTLTWRHKRYWGTHPSFSLPSNAQIIAANGASVGSGSEFATSRVQNRNGIDGAGNYLFFAWPASFGTPTFTINGLPNTAWTLIGNGISFTNASGHIESYDVWISNTAQNSPITLFSIT